MFTDGKRAPHQALNWVQELHVAYRFSILLLFDPKQLWNYVSNEREVRIIVDVCQLHCVLS